MTSQNRNPKGISKNIFFCFCLFGFNLSVYLLSTHIVILFTYFITVSTSIFILFCLFAKVGNVKSCAIISLSKGKMKKKNFFSFFYFFFLFNFYNPSL